MNDKTYKMKGFKYCQLTRDEAYEISKRRLDVDKGKMISIINGMPYSDIDDIRWSSGLVEWLFKAFHLYCKFHRRPQGHKRTDV